MALRSLARFARQLQANQTVAARSFASHASHPPSAPKGHEEDVEIIEYTPTVFDKIITFNVIDKDGIKHSVKALEGQRMSQAMVDSGKFRVSCFMPHLMTKWIPDCHLYIAEEDIDKLPTELAVDWPMGGEDWARWYYFYAMKNFVQDYARPNSFLGYYIHLRPIHNGMTVAIAPLKPWIVDDRKGPSENWMQQIPSTTLRDSVKFV